MAEVTAAMVKELRERTQAPMGQCKTALVEAEGDMEKAIEIIQKKGLLKGSALAGRVATEGEVRTWISPDHKRAIILEVNCQTDFVARSEDFRGFVGKVIEVASTAPKGTDLLAQQAPGTDKTIDVVRQELAGKTGENCVVRRWDVLEAKDPGTYMHAYVHAGGKLAVIVHADAPSAAATADADFRTFVDNTAMQIAAMNPMAVRKEDIPQAQIEKQKEIFEAQLKEEGKPQQAWPKIIEGKLAKWFTEVTLLGQESVTDDQKRTVDQLRKELGKRLGGEVKIVSFVRFALGEGIEKKVDDLAAEVAKMTGG